MKLKKTKSEKLLNERERAENAKTLAREWTDYCKEHNSPRRLRLRYERAGRRPYSAAEAGGAKMTAAQIAEAQRLTREWRPK